MISFQRFTSGHQQRESHALNTYVLTGLMFYNIKGWLGLVIEGDLPAGQFCTQSFESFRSQLGRFSHKLKKYVFHVKIVCKKYGLFFIVNSKITCVK